MKDSTLMKFMKSQMIRCGAFLCFGLLSMAIWAQQPDAKEIMNRTATCFKEAGGVRVDFAVKTYSKKVLQGNSTGSILLKGDKFQLDAEGIKTWFDGKTQWTYIPESGEVNVSEPTPEELQTINPYAFLGLYNHGFSLKKGDSSSYNGRPAYEVVLTAKNRKQDLRCIILYVSKDTFQPLCVSLTEKGGESIAIRITSYKDKQSYSDDLFAFQKKDYPKVELIDLR